MSEGYELIEHDFDVVVVGAGGAGSLGGHTPGEGQLHSYPHSPSTIHQVPVPHSAMCPHRTHMTERVLAYCACRTRPLLQWTHPREAAPSDHA